MNKPNLTTLKLFNGDEIIVHSVEIADDEGGAVYGAEPKQIIFTDGDKITIKSYAYTAKDQDQLVIRLEKSQVLIMSPTDDEYGNFYLKSIGIDVDDTPQIITEAPIGFDAKH